MVVMRGRNGQSVPMDLDAAADELYGVDPDAFVPTRTRLVAEARAAKDRPLAMAIGALAIRSLAVRKAAIRHARIGKLEVDELVIGKITRPDS